MTTELGTMPSNTSLPVFRMAEFQTTMAYFRHMKPTFYRIINDGIICLLHTCRSEIVYPPASETTSPNINGTWTGIIGLLQRGKAEYALAVSIDEDKMKVVDFLNIRFENELATLSPLNTEHVQGDILDAFSRADWKVWLLMALGVLFMAVNAKLLGFRDTKRNTLYDYLHVFLLHLLCEGPPSYFRENALKVLSLFYSFFIIIMDVSLFAYLKTNLVTQQVFVISTLEQLVKQKAPFVIVDRGDIMPAFELGQDTDPIYKAIFHITKKDPGSIVNLDNKLLNNVEPFTKAVHEQRVFIGIRTTLLGMSDLICMFTGDDLKYNVALQPMKGSTLAIPVARKGDPEILKLLKKVSKSFDGAGIIFHFLNTLSNYGEASCFERAEDMSISEAESLELAGFRRTLIFWVTGHAFALAAFVGELLLHRMTTKVLNLHSLHPVRGPAR